MGMSDSKESIVRKFREIVRPQVRPEIANTLADFLCAAPSQHRASDSAVNYVIGKLWLSHDDPREGT